MAAYADETLDAARRLIAREPRQRGRIPAARIRRSISTAYYALFHFLLDDLTQRLVGTSASLLRRRRITARVVSHAGMKLAFERIAKHVMLEQYALFFEREAVPAFARSMALTFLRAQDQRHEADYNLNASLTELDARLLIQSVERLLMLLRGELRSK